MLGYRNKAELNWTALAQTELVWFGQTAPWDLLLRQDELSIDEPQAQSVCFRKESRIHSEMFLGVWFPSPNTGAGLRYDQTECVTKMLRSERWNLQRLARLLVSHGHRQSTYQLNTTTVRTRDLKADVSQTVRILRTTAPVKPDRTWCRFHQSTKSSWGLVFAGQTWILWVAADSRYFWVKLWSDVQRFYIYRVFSVFHSGGVMMW